MPDFTAGLVAAQRRWFLRNMAFATTLTAALNVIHRQRMEWAALVANPGILRRH